MGTIALFITVFILLCIFALIFVCYRAGRDGRQQEALDEEAGAMQRATIVLSIVPGHAAAAALAGQQPYSSQRPRSQRKSPTPPTIIRNLPVVIWDKPKAAKAAPPAHEKDAACVKDAAGKEAGTQDPSSHASTDSSEEEGQERLCVICCCEYEAGESIKLLPCLHMYHQGCIDAWLGRSHVCPVCQADVIRAAGLSAEVGDWSVHTQEAVNVISGVQHHTQTSLMGLAPQQQRPADTQQQEQQQPDGATHQQQQLQQDAGASGQAVPPVCLPVSSPPSSLAAAAPAPSEDGPRVSSSGHSSDAIALVVPRGAAAVAAEGTCRSGLGFRV